MQQRTEGPIIRQQRGIPMGGKGSAEMANLYCYTIESQFIDKLMQEGKEEEAKACGDTLMICLESGKDTGNQYNTESSIMIHPISPEKTLLF